MPEEGQGINIPLGRSCSLPESLSIFEDIKFHSSSKHPLFRTRSEYFISKTVVAGSILFPYIPPPKTEFGRNILQQFTKLKGLVNKVQQTTEKVVLF